MFGLANSLGATTLRSLPAKIRAILKKYGSDAHLYLPGIGVINGFTAGNYFDSAGTTLASVDGSVGLLLDAAGSVGAELAPPIDATWSRDATVSVAGNTFVYVNTPAANNGAYKAVALTVGKTYRITLTVANYISGSISVWLGNQQTGASNAMLQANGTLSFLVSPTGAYNGYFLVGTNTGTTSATVTLASIKEVTGIHATQSTPGYKPTLRKGIVNLLNNSNPTWTSVHGVTGTCTITAGQPDPYGGNTAQRIAAVSNGDYALAQTSIGSSLTGIYTGGLMVKSATGANQTFTIWTDNVAAINVTATQDWQIVAATQSVTANTLFKVMGGDILVARIGLFAGTLTAAQIIAAGGIPLTTTAPASSQAGVNYLEFGGDDYLISPLLAQVGDDYYECIVVAVDADFATYPFISCVGRGAGIGTLGDIYINPEASVGGRSIDNASSATYIVSSNTVQRGVANIIECEKKSGLVRLIVNGVAGEWGATITSNATVSESRMGLGSAIRVFDRVFIKGQVSDADKANFRKQAAAAAGIQL